MSVQTSSLLIILPWVAFAAGLGWMIAKANRAKASYLSRRAEENQVQKVLEKRAEEAISKAAREERFGTIVGR